MGDVSELSGDFDSILGNVRAEVDGGWWMVVGVSLDEHPPEPLIASGQCSDLVH